MAEHCARFEGGCPRAPRPGRRLTRRFRTPVSLGARVLSVALAALLVLGACERREPPATAQSSSEYTPIGAAPGAPAVLAPFTIVCLGDSITAGYGLPEDRSYPALLQARLKAQGLPHRVVNAGVSGDTSAGGLARMDWILKQRVDVLLVALGGNDGLRGLAPEQMERNLAAIVEKGQAAGAKVVLAGMRMPTNYGEDYRRRFEAVYPALARRYGVPLLPFLLDGVGMNPRFNQPDGIHPTAEGAKIVESNVWQVLAPLLRKP